jgi:hypothetical protein
MPTLSEDTQLVRASQAAQVLIMLAGNTRMTRAEACEKVGISETQYDTWIRKDPDALSVIRQFIVQMQRMQLFEIEQAWTIGLSELIADAISKNTRTKDRVLALKFLDNQKLRLEKALSAAPGVEDKAHQFLKEGPTLQRIKSRMASIDVQPSETGVAINISRYDDIIDGKALDSAVPEDIEAPNSASTSTKT